MPVNHSRSRDDNATKFYRWYEFVPLDRKNFLHISPPLDDLLLIGIHPLGNLKDEASTWVHRLCELTRPSVIFCHIVFI